jgi:hypothetical protein
VTRRELTCPHTGPILLDARSLAASIRVSLTDTDRASVTLSTPDASGPSHDAVNSADLESAPGLLTVRLHERGAAAGGITVIGRGNSVAVSAISVGRNVSIVGGRVIIDGAEVTPGSGAPAASPVTINAVLPRGSRVDLGTECADVTVRGHCADARAHTLSGDVEIEHAERANVQTTSGDIRIGHADQALTNTVSGDTRIEHADTLTASAVSGDIRVYQASGMVSAATVSGDITIEHAGPAPLTRTVTGRVRVTAAR